MLKQLLSRYFRQSKWHSLSCIPVSKACGQENSGTNRLTKRVLQALYSCTTVHKGIHIFADVSHYPHQATHRSVLIKLGLICHNYRKDLPPVKPKIKKLFPLKNNEMTIN